VSPGCFSSSLVQLKKNLEKKIPRTIDSHTHTHTISSLIHDMKRHPANLKKTKREKNKGKNKASFSSPSSRIL